MENSGKHVNELLLNSSDYFTLKIKSLRLEFYERLTDAVSEGINAIFLLLLSAFTLLFASVALAFWLGKLLSSYTAGFALIAFIYLACSGLFFLIQKKSDRRRLKNKLLLKIAKDLHDYDTLKKTQHEVDEQLKATELKVKQSFKELKTQYELLKDQFEKARGSLMGKAHGDDGPQIPRLLVRSAVELLLNRFFLKNAGFVTRKIVPVITNSIRSSKMFREKKKAGLFENIKLRISKIL
jgi:hypothetical protein